MKFSPAALCLVLVTGADAARRSLDSSKIQSHLNKVSPQRLLKHARQLDQGQQQQQEFEVTGDYSVKFNECLTLNVLNNQEEGDDEDENNNGNNNNVDHATSIKDYVIVDVISSYDGSVKQFAVDLATFVTTLANYIPEQMEEYCEACDYDYCYNNNGQGDDAAAQNQDADEDNEEDNKDNEEEEGEGNEEDGGGRRFLAENNGKIVYTDCDTCSNMSCFQDEQDGGDENVYSNENALNWLLEVGECEEINEDNYNYNDANGYQLYAGYTCNADGTGMEIGVFADEECSILTTTTFAEVVENGGYGASYQSMSSGLVHRVFQQYFDCMNTEYINPGDDAEEDNNENNEDEDGQFEANEYCQALVEGDDVIAIGESCVDDNNNNGDGQQNNYQYDENGNPWGQYTDANGDIIYYDVQDDEDAEQVCIAIQGKEGDYSTALEGGSKLYDYSNTKNIDNDNKWDLDSGKEGQNDNLKGNSGSGNGLWNKTKNKVHNMANEYGYSAAEMWAIVAASFLFGILAVLFLIRVFCMGKKKAKLDLDDSDDAVTRSRREPLVNNPEVYVA